MQKKEMKLLIAGSRNIDNIDMELYIPRDVTRIISGGAKGVDTLAEQFADKYKIPKTIVRPRYDLYKKGAPLKRNKEMVDMCDGAIVFWDGKSRGTKQTIDYAKKVGKTVVIIMAEEKRQE